MKKNLLKSLRVFCSGLLVTVMCLNLCVRVQAEEKKEYVEQISATLKGTNSLDDCVVDQYYNYSWSGNYTFTPANGLS